ncbi:hypothetical protein HDU98_012282 [Podochytrium sp. JEL0797]|nr:hypothetical protein HDU98_012282 [Podochytrium sp. JEL0797]
MEVGTSKSIFPSLGSIVPSSHVNKATKAKGASPSSSAKDSPPPRNSNDAILASLHLESISDQNYKLLPQRDAAEMLFAEKVLLVDRSNLLTILAKTDEYHKSLLVHYLSFLPLADTDLVTALRTLCTHVPLKGESQQIDRLLTAFAEHWWSVNFVAAEPVFKTQDIVYGLLFSLVLLNTDLYSSGVKYKMGVAGFIKNTMHFVDSMVSVEKGARVEDSSGLIEGVFGGGSSSSFSISKEEHTIWKKELEVELKGMYLSVKATPIILIQDSPKTPANRARSFTIATSPENLPIPELLIPRETVPETTTLLHSRAKFLPSPGEFSNAHQYVLYLTTPTGVFLFQTRTEADLRRWCDTLNYWAARYTCVPAKETVGVGSAEYGWSEFEWETWRRESGSKGDSIEGGGAEGVYSKRVEEWEIPKSCCTAVSVLGESEQMVVLEKHLRHLESEIENHLSFKAPMEKKLVLNPTAKSLALANWTKKWNHMEEEKDRYCLYIQVLQASLSSIK